MKDIARDSRRELLKNSHDLARKRVVKFFYWISALILLVGAVSIGLLNLSKLTITKVTISGNRVLSTESMRRVVDDTLSGRYFFLIPKRSSLFYPRASLEQLLLSTFPRLETATIDYQDLNSIIVSVKERESNYLWCLGNPTEKNCYFIDRTGLVFAKAPRFSDNVFFEMYGRGEGDPIGSRPITTSEFIAILSVYEKVTPVLKQTLLKNDKPLRMIAEEQGDYTIIMERARDKSEAPSDWQLKFNVSSNPEELASNLLSALTSSTFVKELNGKQSLTYIDVRFGKKIFYKFD